MVHEHEGQFFCSYEYRVIQVPTCVIADPQLEVPSPSSSERKMKRPKRKVAIQTTCGVVLETVMSWVHTGGGLKSPALQVLCKALTLCRGAYVYEL